MRSRSVRKCDDDWTRGSFHTYLFHHRIIGKIISHLVYIKQMVISDGSQIPTAFRVHFLFFPIGTNIHC